MSECNVTSRTWLSVTTLRSDNDQFQETYNLWPCNFTSTLTLILWFLMRNLNRKYIITLYVESKNVLKI